jgi:SAM-dependent methyltransferase
MKICISCGYRFEGEDWQCAKCGYLPEMLDGYPFFAPQLVDTYGGFEARFFHLLAEIEKGNFWFESRNRLLIWALRRYFSNAQNFLEIGCGTGFVLSGIHQEFPKVVLYGSDLFVEGLMHAQKRVPKAFLFQMDARNIPFAEEFDVIGAFDVLEHIEEDETVLIQMHQAVCQRGGIILTVPQHPFLWSRRDDYAHHLRRYTAQELRAKVENAGFEVLKITSFVSLLLPLMMISRYKDRHSAAAYDPMSEVNINNFLNNLFERILDFERWIIRLRLSFPIGGSLLLVARKVSK